MFSSTRGQQRLCNITDDWMHNSSGQTVSLLILLTTGCGSLCAICFMCVLDKQRSTPCITTLFFLLQSVELTVCGLPIISC